MAVVPPDLPPSPHPVVATLTRPWWLEWRAGPEGAALLASPIWRAGAPRVEERPLPGCSVDVGAPVLGGG